MLRFQSGHLHQRNLTVHSTQTLILLYFEGNGSALWVSVSTNESKGISLREHTPNMATAMLTGPQFGFRLLRNSELTSCLIEYTRIWDRVTCYYWCTLKPEWPKTRLSGTTGACNGLTDMDTNQKAPHITQHP